MKLLSFFNQKKIPVILQTETTECGLACLCMIANYYGFSVDLSTLRMKFSISLKGINLHSLINISAHLNLGVRPLRVDLESLLKVNKPAILHWDLNHFVVLKKISGNKLHIHDPALGLRVISMKEASDHFTGVVLECIPTAEFEKKSVPKNKMKLSKLWEQVIGLKRALIQLLMLSVIIQLIALAMPFYMQTVVDEVIVKYDKNLLLVLTVAFLGLSLIHKLTSLMRAWAIIYFGNHFYFQMIANLFKHLMNLPTAYFEKRHLGDILSRMGSTKPIQTALTESIIAGIIDGAMAITTGIVLFIYSPFLALIVCSALVLNFVITFIMYPVLRRIQEEAIVVSAKENTHMIESIRASTTIKLFEEQNQRLSIWRNLFADSINASMRNGKYDIILNAAHGIIGGISSILVVYYGATLVLSEGTAFTVGMLFAFMAYRGNFVDSIVSLIDKVLEFRLLGLHLERISDIAQAKLEVKSSEYNEILETEFKGAIQVKNLSFRYSEEDPWIFRNINLTIAPGDFVAFIGPSGGGKTTLMKLILGLYPPTEGEILIDGHSLKELKPLWRKKIGVVLQDDKLLSGSLADNIGFFSPELNMEQVQSAAKLALIHEEIMAMPMNYLSLIGDMGSALSEGQKQRILLARAFYKEPSLLCLDEGTANIDEQTERRIVDYIATLKMTRLIVAHRPAFIEHATRKIIVHQEQITEINN